MPAKERFKTKYPGVFFLMGRAVATDEAEKIFYIFYRKDGRQIEEKVGRQFQDAMTAAKAAQVRVERINRKEPANKERREAVQAAKDAEESRPTIARLWQQVYTDQKTVFKSLRQDEYRFRKYIEPVFGKKEPIQIAPFDIDRLRIKLTRAGKKPQTVKNIMAILKRVILFGVKRRLCPALNFDIELPKVDNLKTEFLTEEELQRLFISLDEESNIQGANIIRLSLFAGLRFGEICKLRWVDVDLERGFLLLKDTKPGKDKRIPLNDLALDLLRLHPRTASEYVFPGRDGALRVTNRHVATRVRDRAGLPKDFRYHHGLRHTFASYIANAGIDSYVGHKLLGHEDQKMWTRYAHLADSTLKDAAQAPADVFKAIIAGGKDAQKPAAKVVNLHRK